MDKLSYKKKIEKAKALREEFRVVYSEYTNSLTEEINSNLKLDCEAIFPNIEIAFIINQYNCAFMEYQPTISLYYKQNIAYDKDLLKDWLNDISLYRKVEKFANEAFAKYSVPVYIFHKQQEFKRPEKVFTE